MPIQLPDNIHDNCKPLVWLLGTWSGTGRGTYPTIEDFQFRQDVIFQQDGRPFIHYMSTSMIIDDDGNKVRDAAQETGFIRPQPDRTLEFVMTHNIGFTEIWHGEMHPERPSFEMATDTVARTATAKEYTAGKRMYGYVEGQLMYAFDMAAMGQELQPHLWAQLQRQ